MEGDKEPLMMEKPSAEEKEEAKSFEDLEIEAKDGCCDRNLAFLLSIIILLTFIVVWEGMKLYALFNNDYFDEMYYILYLILAILLLLLYVFLLVIAC
jgi:hypothetical protein